MKILKENLNDLESTLIVTIEKEDYNDKFLNELKKNRKKAQIRGFRKGKAPLSTIKKLYGKAILADTVNDLLQNSLNEYITKENIKLLGNPIPSESEEPVDFDLKELDDFEFKFDIGEAPEFDVKGISESDEYSDYKVIVSDEIISKEIDLLRNKLGDNELVDEDIEENDILTIKAFELENEALKEKGWETGFTILVNRIADETLKEEIIKLKKGDKFSFDIYTLEKDTDENFVNKYLLNLDDDEEKEIGNHFEGTIEKVSRRMKAELNQEFFDKAFGEGKITTEEEAKELIGAEIGSHYSSQSKSLTYREILEKLMEINEIKIPEDFLKRWLKSSNEGITDSNIEQEFDDFRKNLKWTLVKSKLASQYEIKVEPEEIRERAQAKIISHMGQYQNHGLDLNMMTQHYLQNKEQVEREYEEILADKVFKEIESKVTLVEKNVSSEEFSEMVKTMNERLNTKQ